MLVAADKLRRLFQGWTVGDWLASFASILPATVVALAVLSNVVSYLWGSAGGNSGDFTQESMAKAAWAGVLVGAASIVMLYRTLRATAQSVEVAQLAIRASEVMGRKQVRAYVGFHDGKIAIANPDDFYTPPLISIDISNFGQSPATRMRMKLGWQNHEPLHLPTVNSSEPHSMFELGPGQKNTERIPCDDFVKDALAGTYYADLRSWCHGVVEYDDVFGEKHETWFRMKITGSHSGRRKILHVEQTQDGNCST